MRDTNSISSLESHKNVETTDKTTQQITQDNLQKNMYLLDSVKNPQANLQENAKYITNNAENMKSAIRQARIDLKQQNQDEAKPLIPKTSEEYQKQQAEKARNAPAITSMTL